jgi:hypothetical protein
MALDAQAITRIIDAVEAVAEYEFPAIDRAALQKDLEHARTYYAEMKVKANKPGERKLAKRVALFSKLGRQISDQLGKGFYAFCTAKSFHRVGSDSPEDLLRAVQPGIDLNYQRSTSSDELKLLGRSGSPFELLTGQYLRDIFLKYFEIEHRFTIDPDSGQAYGPYVEFAYQALIELKILNDRTGKAYTRKSIADALAKIQPIKRQNRSTE